MAKPTVLLYPGAGSSRDHSSLVAIERRLGRSAAVERIDFPYRREGRRAPDRAPKLMASIRDDLTGFARRRGPIVMGGRSMGGRMASMVAADVDGGGAVARLAGLVLDLLSAASAGQAGEPPCRASRRHLGAVPVHLGHEGSVRFTRRVRCRHLHDDGTRRTPLDRGRTPRPEGRRRHDRRRRRRFVDRLAVPLRRDRERRHRMGSLIARHGR